MEVSSPLSFDTNVVVVGEPVVIRVSGVGQGEGGDILVTASSVPPAEIEVRRESEGEEEEDSYVVSFKPKEAVPYKLEVMCKDEHILGSPFNLKAMDRATLTGDGEGGKEERSSSVDTGESVTLVLPGIPHDPVVLVTGPQGGECEALLSSEGSISFLPNQPGRYCISVRPSSGETGEEYHITARDFQLGSMYCRVVEEDEALFKSPIKFTDGVQVSFRVYTKEALGMNLLQVVALGPGQAQVTVLDNKDGTESVLFSPSCPGRYTLDVLWNIHHIQGSPFSLQFKQPKNHVVSNSLSLDREVFIIDTPHRFKLNCEGAKDGDIQLSCDPPSAASTSVQPTTTPSTYFCQIVPHECGRQQVSVLFQKAHVPGSPFPVLFRLRGDASKCQLEGTLDQVQTNLSLKFSVTTHGAGEGRLTAVGREKGRGKRIVAKVTQTEEEKYMVEFNPGRSTECELGVLYDGQHIPGSPFQLLFISGASFSVEGDGLVQATRTQWNVFTVNSRNAGPGALSVFIRGPDGNKLKANVFARGLNVFDVHYFPSQTGRHVIAVKWGKQHIPGSPFHILCSSQDAVSKFTIWKPSSKVPLGTPIEFTVEDGRPEKEEDEEDCITVHAKAHRNDVIIEGSAQRDMDDNFVCELLPPKPGRYSVSVLWRGEHLPGSPFKVIVPAPPRPEKVRLWGRGLGDHWLSSEGSSFTVDTAQAGTGILGIKVSTLLCPNSSFFLLTQPLPSFPSPSTRYMDQRVHSTSPLRKTPMTSAGCW